MREAILIAFVSLNAFVIVTILARTEPDQDLFDQQAQQNPGYREVVPLMKRPFCNAFTGCGRKRSVVQIPYGYRQLLPTIGVNNGLWPFLRMRMRQVKYQEDEPRNEAYKLQRIQTLDPIQE